MKLRGNLSYKASASALAFFLFLSVAVADAQDAQPSKPKAKIVLDQDNYVPGASVTPDRAETAGPNAANAADAPPATGASAKTESADDGSYDVLAYKKEAAKALQSDISSTQARIQILTDQIAAETDAARRSDLVLQKERSETALRAMLAHQDDLTAEIEKLKQEKPESERKPEQVERSSGALDQTGAAQQQNGTETSPE